MRTLAVMAVLFLVFACQAPPPEMTEAERAQIEADVAAVMQQYMEGFNELDMEKVAQTAHPSLTRFPYGGRVLNWADYRAALIAWAEGKQSWSGGWLETDVRVMSPDLAVATGTYTDTIQYSDGRHLYRPSSASVFLFQRTPEGWKWSLGGNSSPTGQPIEQG